MATRVITSTFCCADCSFVHTSEHTVIDTFCPKCGSARDNQGLIVCFWCSMPLCRNHSMWLHAGDPPLRDHHADPVPVLGLMSDVWIDKELVKDMKVVSGSGSVRILKNEKCTVKVIRAPRAGHFRVVGDSRVVSFLKG